MSRIAVLSVAPSVDLDEGERMDQFELVMKFRSWCRKCSYVPDIRELPADPEGHAERRRLAEAK